MSRRRVVALAVLLGALAAYGALAGRLPELPDGVDVAFLSLVLLPAFAAAIWIALPLAHARLTSLLGAAGVAGIVAAALETAGADSGANVAKLGFYAVAGYAFLVLFEEVWWIALVAVLVPWVDIWSVAAGPTEYVVEKRPGIFERISVELRAPGDGASVHVGPPDVVFFALFLGAAERFGLRVGWTWVAMTSFLATTLVLVWTWDDVSGLPALPAVCLGFVVPNADLLWQSVRAARAGRLTE